ncbi:hypothetical protein [uncultured Sphingomonas sp.]|uniref:hypothetical protein n=1 Tax=uncultured Sphingomonas sp. TaxID=158754 RepID=UPI0025CEEDA7|nr:hypothetical protein [uncultured Sphingomonas sp.]
MAWLMLAQAIVAASGPVVIESKEQARAMAALPQSLADELLAPGHPPVDDAQVDRWTGMPPPPPGSPPQFRVQLQTRPEPAEPGFCKRTAIDLIVLNPGPAATSRIADTRVLYRLGARCAVGRNAYGEYSDTIARDAIRALDALQKRRRIDVSVMFDDRMPESVDGDRYPDGVAALRAVPLREVSWAGPASRARFSNAMTAAADDSIQIGFYASGSWSGVVTIRNSRIIRVALSRSIPPPF